MAAVPLILARGEERSAVVVIVCIHNCRTISIGEGTSAAPLVGLAVCTIFLYVPSSRWDFVRLGRGGVRPRYIARLHGNNFESLS